jgi:hypothetical protein
LNTAETIVEQVLEKKRAVISTHSSNEALIDQLKTNLEILIPAIEVTFEKQRSLKDTSATITLVFKEPAQWLRSTLSNVLARTKLPLKLEPNEPS